MLDEITVPRYAQQFECLGSRCPDTCCAGWIIPVDRAIRDAWHTLRFTPRAPTLNAAACDMDADQQQGGLAVAQMVKTTTGVCSMLSDDKLCSVQTRFGVDMLPLMCHAYPRGRSRAGDRHSMYLTVSCPQVATLALSDPSAMDLVPATLPQGGRPPPVTERLRPGLAAPEERDDPALGVVEATAEVLAETAQALIRAPALTATQAWSLFWWRLNEILGPNPQAVDKAAAIDRILALRLEAQAGGGLLAKAQAAERAIQLAKPIATRLQLASRLNERAKRRYGPFESPVRDALGEALSALGVDDACEVAAGNEPCRRYEQALAQWLEPFEARHPHVMKNYLLNRLGIENFPMGGTEKFQLEVSTEAHHLDMLRVFLTGRALIKREKFSVEDCVAIVQAYARYVM